MANRLGDFLFEPGLKAKFYLIFLITIRLAKSQTGPAFHQNQCNQTIISVKSTFKIRVIPKKM